MSTQFHGTAEDIQHKLTAGKGITIGSDNTISSFRTTTNPDYATADGLYFIPASTYTMPNGYEGCAILLVATGDVGGGTGKRQFLFLEDATYNRYRYSTGTWSPWRSGDIGTLLAGNAVGGLRLSHNDFTDADKATISNTANALKGTASGLNVVTMDDVSPVEHELSIKVDSKNLIPYTSVTIRRMGKNLLPYPYYNTTKTTAGITFTDNGDGSITANGTATGNAIFYFWVNENIGLPDGVYSLSGNPNSQGSLFARGYYTSTLLGIGTDTGSGSANCAVTGHRSDGITVYYRITAGTTVENLVIKPQLEFGAVITEYEQPKTVKVYAPKADGTVDGVTSVYPIMTLMSDADGVTIDCEYNRDINKWNNVETELLNPIKGTTQRVTFNSNGTVSQITHTDSGGNVLRTDTFAYSGNVITETRTLATGETITIATDTKTLVTEVR